MVSERHIRDNKNSKQVNFSFSKSWRTSKVPLLAFENDRVAVVTGFLYMYRLLVPGSGKGLLKAFVHIPRARQATHAHVTYTWKKNLGSSQTFALVACASLQTFLNCKKSQKNARTKNRSAQGDQKGKMLLWQKKDLPCQIYSGTWKRKRETELVTTSPTNCQGHILWKRPPGAVMTNDCCPGTCWGDKLC